MANIPWDGSTDGTFTDATNWVGGVAPVAADIPVFPSWASQDVDGSDQSATAFGGYIYEEGCTIAIGSAETPLKLGLANDATVSIDGEGELYIQHNAGTGAAVTIRGDATVDLGGVTGNLATNIYILAEGATVGIARQDAWTAKVDNIYQKGESSTYIGTGVTSLAAAAVVIVESGAGDLTCFSAVATMTIEGGEAAQHAAVSTALTVTGEETRLDYYGSGTIANIARSTGHIDFTKDSLACTVTDCEIDTGAHIGDPEDRVTWTDAIQLSAGCGMGDVTIEGGVGKKIGYA